MNYVKFMLTALPIALLLAFGAFSIYDYVTTKEKLAVETATRKAEDAVNSTLTDDLPLVVEVEQKKKDRSVDVAKRIKPYTEQQKEQIQPDVIVIEPTPGKPVTIDATKQRPATKPVDVNPVDRNKSAIATPESKELSNAITDAFKF